VETLNQLFLFCSVVSIVRRKVITWLDLNFITLNNLFVHLMRWSNRVRSKKLKRVYGLIWHVRICVISSERNGKIFNDKVCGDRTFYNFLSIFFNHFLLVLIQNRGLLEQFIWFSIRAIHMVFGTFCNVF